MIIDLVYSYLLPLCCNSYHLQSFFHPSNIHRCLHSQWHLIILMKCHLTLLSTLNTLCLFSTTTSININLSTHLPHCWILCSTSSYSKSESASLKICNPLTHQFHQYSQSCSFLCMYSTNDTWTIQMVGNLNSSCTEFVMSSWISLYTICNSPICHSFPSVSLPFSTLFQTILC
jgi:hypothetical protein